MNLNKIQISQEGVEMPLYHPKTDEKTDTVLLVIGRDHPEYRKREREVQKRLMKLVTSRQTDALLTKTIEESESENLERAIMCVVGWKNVSWEDDLPLEFSQENVRKILSDKNSVWIVDQILAFVQDRANFIKAS